MVAKKSAKKKKSSKNSGSSKKKTTEKKRSKKSTSKKTASSKETTKEQEKKFPSLKLTSERQISMDFASKVYKRFGKMIKSIILFGSSAKQEQVAGSDIDIIIVIDDASINWDQELIAWYREELDKILKVNPYIRKLHINTVKLTTWWRDTLRGDPVILNVLRSGETLIDVAGFFRPLKSLLLKGEIRASPEAIYTTLERAPQHLARSKSAQLGTIEGVFWSMVDSAHSALIAADVFPPSPEHIPGSLAENFVDNRRLKRKYVDWYKEILDLHKKISHGKTKDVKGAEIDEWQDRAQEFLDEMAKLTNKIVEEKAEE